MNSEVLKPLIKKLTIFAKDRLNFKTPPRLFLRSDDGNANCSLGKTGFYDPGNKSITLFVTNRHPKDILRSFAHELVHHCQNERGDLRPEKMKSMNKNYAQENPHMRKMEEEAYLQGNMCFRDWEDSMDDKLKYKISLAEQKFLKENKKMSVKITKKQLTSLIERLLDENFDTTQESIAAKFKDAIAKRGKVEASAQGITNPKVKKKKPVGKSSQDAPMSVPVDENLEEEEISETTCSKREDKPKKKRSKSLEEEKCPKCNDGSCEDCKAKTQAKVDGPGPHITAAEYQEKYLKKKKSVKEGEIPQGLKDYMDKKKKKEPAGKTSQDAPMSVPADDEGSSDDKESAGKTSSEAPMSVDASMVRSQIFQMLMEMETEKSLFLKLQRTQKRKKPMSPRFKHQNKKMNFTSLVLRKEIQDCLKNYLKSGLVAVIIEDKHERATLIRRCRCWAHESHLR